MNIEEIQHDIRRQLEETLGQGPVIVATADLGAICDEVERLNAKVAEWEDYWGCESPHDSHVQSGEPGQYARQLGLEQARANRAENKYDDQAGRYEEMEGELDEAHIRVAALESALRDVLKGISPAHAQSVALQAGGNSDAE